MNYEQLKYIKNIDKPSGRVYDTPSGTYPSITTMLSKTGYKPGLDRWKERVGEEEAKRITANAAERGSGVHSLLEEFYTRESNPTLEDLNFFFNDPMFKDSTVLVQNMFSCFAHELIRNKFTSLAQEFVVWDDSLKIAGRSDGVGYWNGEKVIIDYKTSTKKKDIQYIRDYYLQASFYTIAHNKLLKDNIKKFVILIVSEKLTTQAFIGSPVYYIPELKLRVKEYYAKYSHS